MVERWNWLGHVAERSCKPVQAALKQSFFFSTGYRMELFHEGEVMWWAWTYWQAFSAFPFSIIWEILFSFSPKKKNCLLFAEAFVMGKFVKWERSKKLHILFCKRAVTVAWKGEWETVKERIRQKGFADFFLVLQILLLWKLTIIHKKINNYKHLSTESDKA